MRLPSRPRCQELLLLSVDARAINSLLLDLTPLLLIEPRRAPPASNPLLHLAPLLLLPPSQRRRGMDSEPKDPWLVPLHRLDRDQSRVDLHQDVVEGGAEVRTVDGGVARRLRVVHVFALGAV